MGKIIALIGFIIDLYMIIVSTLGGTMVLSMCNPHRFSVILY